MIWLTNDIHHSIFSCLVGTEYDLWIRINGDPLILSYFSPGHTLTRTTDDFLQNDTFIPPSPLYGGNLGLGIDLYFEQSSDAWQKQAHAGAIL